MKECIGCGFCCLMEQCRASEELHGQVEQCPELIFKDGRHWCALVEKKPKLVKDMIGIGCGAHWNRWRDDVKERTKEDYQEYYDTDILGDLVRAYTKYSRKS